MDDVISFHKISIDDVLEFISTAKNRIIFIKPAFMKKEVEALIEVVIDKKVTCNLFYEAGDKAIRYGFGETSALDILEKNFEKFNIQIDDRIRIVVLVVDDKALVYMPNINFIEEDSCDLTFPNGFWCNATLTDEIVKNFTLKGENESAKENTNSYTSKYSSDEILKDRKSTLEKLKKSPAIDPSKLTMIQIYRNKYKLLKIQICGINIENKRISLNQFYSLLPEINEQFISSWNVFSKEDIESLQETRIFNRELKIINSKYKDFIIDGGRFGSIIDSNKKDEYKKEIFQLRDEFKQFLRSDENISDEIIKRFQPDSSVLQINNQRDLLTVLNDSRERLEKHLFNDCLGNLNILDKIFHLNEYRHLKRKYIKGINEQIILKEFVEMFVYNNLKFPESSDIVKKIDVKLDIYDVSDDLINDNEDFIKIIDKHELELRQTTEGYEGT